jgi:hypothetical protein
MGTTAEVPATSTLWYRKASICEGGSRAMRPLILAMMYVKVGRMNAKIQRCGSCVLKSTITFMRK